MTITSLNTAEPANPNEANRKKAHDGLKVLQHWKNGLNHVPFNLTFRDDGHIPLSQAQGMIEVLSAPFSAARDDAEQPSEIANISDSSAAAALDGISALMDLSRLEADAFEYSRALKNGRAA